MSHVLVIDDDPFVFATVEAALAADGHSLDYAADGAAGVAAARARPPDVVLLDIELPGQDGYAVCRELHREDRLADSVTIFVSAHGGTAERLAAYDAGGDDFVVKPFAAEELRRKVALAVRHRGTRETLRSDAGMATQVAMTAMSDSGSIGVILGFFRESFRVNDPGELAAALLRATGEYGLDAAVRLALPDGVCVLNSQGRSSAMEGVLLANLADGGERIVAMGRKLLVAYPHVVVLVKNLPEDDEARCGRLRDHLAMLAEGAEERLRALGAELLVRDAVRLARSGIDAIDAGYRRQQSRNMAIMDGLMQGLERLLPSLGLTMAQENQLIDLVQRATRDAIAAYDDGLALDDAFAGLRHLLEQGSPR